jgi:hypothetical protein
LSLANLMPGAADGAGDILRPRLLAGYHHPHLASVQAVLELVQARTGEDRGHSGVGFYDGFRFLHDSSQVHRVPHRGEAVGVVTATTRCGKNQLVAEGLWFLRGADGVLVDQQTDWQKLPEYLMVAYPSNRRLDTAGPCFKDLHLHFKILRSVWRLLPPGF